MKLMWTGSDALFATRFLGGRRFPTRWQKYPYMLALTVLAKLADRVIEGHYVASEETARVLTPLKLRAPIRVLNEPARDVSHIKRPPRSKWGAFTVIYYCPLGGNQRFKDWCYGLDIFNEVASALWDTVFFERIYGDSDMDEVYRHADFLLRPNRSDGDPRMVRECEALGIPVYHTTTEPSVADAIMAITSAQEAR